MSIKWQDHISYLNPGISNLLVIPYWQLNNTWKTEKHWETKLSRKLIFILAGNTLRAVLCLVVAIFLVQYIGIYLNFSMYKSLSTRLARIQTELGLDENQLETSAQTAPRVASVKGRTEAILYSYYGIDTLPSGDILSDVLANHPDIFYMDRPLKYAYVFSRL